MKQHRTSLVGRTIQRVSQLWSRRRRQDRDRLRRAAFLFEPLESRHLMAGDLDQGEGEGTAPTLQPLPNIVLNGGSPQWVPLDGLDVEGGPLTYTVTSNNPGLVQTNIPAGNESLKMSVAGFGDMYFQLFEHLAPRVTSRIIDLVNSGFYDDTATNTITFHRILNDFVVQAGDPTGTGSGGSTLGTFADQFHVDLQHNRSGLLSMAKSSDDTNDSQFFITEERNESQFITLTGSPTGGTFTLSYFDQTTSPIAFDNAGNFTTMAASIQSALAGLSRIGAGNVVVTHAPGTENRRWKVDFVGALAHQEVVNLTGSASGLTGGSNRSITVDETKSARHLDFNHSIFGLLTQGESVRDAISNVTTNASGTPTTPPVISNVDIVVDSENGALLLKAAEGASGETDVTVRVTDAQGNFSERTFHVIVTPDGFDGSPFLQDIGPVQGTADQPILLQLVATDAENNTNFFDAVKPTGNAVNYTINVNNNTGLVTLTPPVGFVGTFNVIAGVRGAVQSDTGDQFDTQTVAVTVAAAAPGGIDLLAASDTGFSNSDNITNASSQQFQISGVTNGATVKLKRGTETLAQGVASGNTIALNVTTLGTFGDGVHSLRATQTVGTQESDLSAALDVTLDTTAPAAFTTTPPSEASVGLPLTYDATAPGEGGAGFVYSLTSAPTGASVNGVTGQLTWTPTVGQVGNHVFQIVATDAAGNSTPHTLNLTVAEPVPAEIEVTIELTDTDGNALTNLGTNQEFVLHLFVKDVRAVPQGVAVIYLDIFFDPTKAETIGPIVYGTNYQLFKSGTTTTPGLIDEVGAFGPLTPIGAGKFELVSVRMRAKQGGLLTFTTDPTDDPENRPAAVYLDAQNDDVPFEAIRFGTASITVNSTFQAVNDTVNVNEDAQNQTLTPLANDTIQPGSGNVLTIAAVGATNSGGTVTIAADGKSLLYTPAVNFFGTETFTYTARNQTNETSLATIVVQVQPQNDPPTAVDDAINVPEDSQNFSLDVLANDLITPDAGETKKVTAVTQPATGGSVAVGPSGNSVSFTPTLNFIGTTTFTYTLSDGNGGTDTASVTLTVSEANDNPVAVADTATVVEESTGNAINVLANDTLGPDTGETLTISAVSASSAQGGTVTIGTGGNVLYTPAANFQGTDTFTYTIGDGRGGTATGTATVTVTNTNDPPTANADTLSAFKNSATELNVLANDSSAPDPAEALTIDSLTQPAHGTVQISANGTRVTYTPTTDYTGPDTFTYKIKDPTGAVSQSATVNLTVQAFIPSTLAGFVYFDVDNDGSKDGAESVLSGVTVTLTGTDINSTAVNRTLKTGVDGSYKFDNLAPGAYTIAQTQPAFTIDGKEAVGSQGGTKNQNDRIVVQLAQNTNGINNNFGERGRQAATITLADFFSSASRSHITAALDGAGNSLWQSIEGTPFQPFTNPVVTLQNGATLVKVEGTNGQTQPVAATLPLTDARVRVLGSSGSSQLLQVSSFQLTNNNTPPTAVANQYTTAEDAPLSVSIAQGLLANDTDPNGNALTAVVVTQPAHGTLTFNANGSFLFTPTANYNGPDAFTYRASDGQAQSAAATVTLTVTAVNDAPAGVNDNYTTNEDATLNVAVGLGVLANDSDADGTAPTATVVAQPQNGTLTLAANGSFTYIPTPNFSGTDGFSYTAGDGTVQSQVVAVTLTVVEQPEGEGESANLSDAALLSLLADGDEGGLFDPLGWEDAVDAALADLA